MRKIDRMGNIRTARITGLGEAKRSLILQGDMPREVELIADLPYVDTKILSGDDALMEANAHDASLKARQ